MSTIAQVEYITKLQSEKADLRTITRDAIRLTTEKNSELTTILDNLKLGKPVPAEYEQYRATIEALRAEMKATPRSAANRAARQEIGARQAEVTEKIAGPYYEAALAEANGHRAYLLDTDPATLTVDEASEMINDLKAL